MLRMFNTTATGVTGSKYARVHNNIPRKPSNEISILSISVNGAKELKSYIDAVTDTFTEIRATFESDLNQSAAKCEELPICLGDHEFRAKMCVICHNDLVHAATKLPQSSPFLQGEEAAVDALAQLECLRKMLVNNKQQKKTSIRRIRRLIANDLKTVQLLPSLLGVEVGKQASVVDTHIRMLSLEDEPASVKGFRKLIEETKKTHRTISRNLLKQVNSQMKTMRNLYIPAYINAAQITAGAISVHASACQAFLRQTLHLAVIQYCASLWWHEYEKAGLYPELNSSECHVIAELASESRPSLLEKKFDISRTASYMAFVDEDTPIPKIRISVYGNPVKPAKKDTSNSNGNSNCNDETYETPLLCAYDFDQTLAETIFTDEAVAAFENAQRAHKTRFGVTN